MKPLTPILVLLAAALGGAGGWFAAHRGHTSAASPSPTAGPKRVLYYQSAMHPWIRSDKPGKCTICGMELTPVHEGETGRSAGPGIVALSSNGVSVLGVEVSPVRKGPLVRTLRVAGVIDDDDSKHRLVSAWVGGRIDELHVNYVGAEVEAGQPLARFYSPMLLEAERQYLAVLGRSGHAGTASNPIAAEHALLRDSSAQRLRQLGLTDAQVAALPAKSPTNHLSDILAPVGGTIVSRFAYAGQYVMEGEKLFEIADFSTMWFRFDAYEQDLPWIRVGQKVAVTTPSLPGQVMDAAVTFIDPNLDPMTRSAKIRVELPSPWVGEGPSRHRLLRHRLFADARVSTTAPEVLLIPRSAVLSPDGKPVVFVDLGGGAFERKIVELGRRGDVDYELLSGLDEGDKVVVAGNLMIDAQAQLDAAIRQADEAAHEPHAADHAPEGRP